jgi:hypothetical protein
VGFGQPDHLKDGHEEVYVWPTGEKPQGSFVERRLLRVRYWVRTGTEGAFYRRHLPKWLALSKVA